MEVAAAATAMLATSLPEGSPAVTATATRDGSQTPGRDTIQSQSAEEPTEKPMEKPMEKPVEKPIEAVTNGVKVNNGMDSRDTTSSPTITSRTPPSQPPTSQPPPPSQLSTTNLSSAQPSGSTPPVLTQPPSTQPSSMRSPIWTQPQPLPQPVLTQPSSSMPPFSSQPAQTVPAASHNYPRSFQASQPPHQNYLRPPCAAVPPPSSAPPSLQAEQSQRQPRDVGRVPKRFPSPDFDHDTRIPKFNRDLSLLADAVQQSCPEAVRRVIRDKWEKCIMGSEFHHAFLMNALIHHASGTIMRRAVRDFGQNMVSEARHEIAAHLRSQDIDEIASVILEGCSDQFLDRALEKRLTTIDARSLINALARAERLGYESSDILEDRPEKLAPMAQMHSPGFTQASLIANAPPQPQPQLPVHARSSLLPQTQPTQHSSPVTDLRCRLCWRTFQNTKPYEYHVQKQICMKTNSDAQKYQHWCQECGAGFTTKVGQQYHIANAVCGLHATAPATPKPQAPAPKSDVPPLSTIPSTQLPPASQYYATPVQPTASYMESPGSSADDPYKHLTAEKRAALDEELRQAELIYAPRFEEAKEIADPVARKAKVDSLQNTFSTKQSMIRKRYGVRLRVRRTRAEIEGERSRMGLKHGLSSPGFTVETPSAKRQKSDHPVQSPVPSPINHLSVSEMNNSGLGGSTATAATTDPTASTMLSQVASGNPEVQSPPSNSLSSLQRKGYRVSSHVGQTTQSGSPPAPTATSTPIASSTPATAPIPAPGSGPTPGPVHGPTPTRTPTSGSPVQRSGSASAPVVLDDSSDDTETDEDIPATIPPRRPS
ncbi:hypothetical protein GGR51DRAFT_529492 [Nemania sp. FL0031]|nr:hypothetical protein GGR51DRAFT_529492 [Nemania sp. FL0031]